MTKAQFEKLKPSALIRVAVKDLSEVEKMPKTYKVDMGTFHSPNSHCRVCFAGSVMARTLNSDPEDFKDPNDFGPVSSGRLEALDQFRMGHVGGALETMEAKIPTTKALAMVDDWGGYDIQEVKLLPAGLQMVVKVPQYSRAKSPQFKKAMLGIAKMLEKVGL